MQLLCLSLVVMRCQPLRRALGENRRSKCQYTQLHPKVCQLMPI
ncbi:acetyltransferase [Vibrio cholerae]|nr:acetyltransferase [Vibrio cholerae]